LQKKNSQPFAFLRFLKDKPFGFIKETIVKQYYAKSLATILLTLLGSTAIHAAECSKYVVKQSKSTKVECQIHCNSSTIKVWTSDAAGSVGALVVDVYKVVPLGMDEWMPQCQSISNLPQDAGLEESGSRTCAVDDYDNDYYIKAYSRDRTSVGGTIHIQCDS
jgi:hypothetical protein